MLTQEKLKELLTYDPETGNFEWINAKANKLKRNSPDGCVWGGVYRYICIYKKTYAQHRLAFLYMSGEYPNKDQLVDHINKDKQDNRFINLRIVTALGNAQNKSLRQKSNKTGHLGVYKSVDGKKYIAQIRHEKKLIHLGTFPDVLSAQLAYIKAKLELHTHFVLEEKQEFPLNRDLGQRNYFKDS